LPAPGIGARSWVLAISLSGGLCGEKFIKYPIKFVIGLFIFCHSFISLYSWAFACAAGRQTRVITGNFRHSTK
jgi:hypothetical protein